MVRKFYSLDQGSANDEKYVNKEDLESGHEKEEERRNDVLEEKVIDENRNESAVNVKTNIKKDVSIEEKLVESDKDGNKDDDNRCEKGTEIEKKVRFNLDETDIEKDNPFVEIKVQVDTVVETVLRMQEEEDDGKHRIDDF